jgi:hypothetical protein
MKRWTVVLDVSEEFEVYAETLEDAVKEANDMISFLIVLSDDQDGEEGDEQSS